MDGRARLYVDRSQASHEILELVESVNPPLRLDVIRLTSDEVHMQRVALPCLLVKGMLLGPMQIRAYLQAMLADSGTHKVTAK